MMDAMLAKENGWRYSSQAPHKTGAGIGTPLTTIAHNRAFAVFLCVKHGHIRIMVGRAGQPQGWPVPMVAGSSNPVRLTTYEFGTSRGEFIKLTIEDAIMATIPALSHPQVTVENGRAVTTSVAVAEFFGKLHKNVIQKIEMLECSSQFTELNFKPSEYTDSTGRKLPMYQITKNGFVFLVMGFTGKRAAAFKEAYIAEFDRMENELRLSSGRLIKGDSRTVVVHFDEAGNVTSTERVSDDAVVTTISQFKFWMEKNGWLVIHRDDIRKMTVEQLVSLK
ncbi:transcriptional regulator [Salmonella enterica subsp. enterica serovar Oranienburg]|uniref:Transcriptional regulator n=1 Tax=Citrobacter braakii TaxID=57706 RepID=A0A1V8P3Z9_CITBR|nr:Rha family phage regulatory protein [Citrobacter braakii]EAA7552780.1 transcriptional regulator [Salmonella enterica]EBV1275565.1 transcriptional regulator [Salmonella enterica subsp. enterica serovar Oranienburg]ECE6270488.1 transcriptional regulator [Salmonella enterica subsp. diarizonae]EDM1360245.1 transcriptional regulator [Salmonella enterica subsp. enterica serovar Newport]EDQ6557083.1 transcriptional regulator [Salmonella enterica subsp. enterica]EEO7206120.1 transcriptional regula